MIKAIIFDFGGVFNNAHDSMAGFAVAAQRFGRSPQALYDLFYSGPEWQAAKLGQTTSDVYWRQIMGLLDLDPQGDVTAFRADLFAGEQLDAGVVALTQRLHEHYPLALLSNATDELEWLLEHRFGVHHLFDVVINSARVGVAKPDPRAYRLALDGLHMAAHETLFVDDKPRNIAAAEALGIAAVLFTDASALEADLQQRGLLP